MARCLRWRPQRRALAPRLQDGRQELPRALACRRHQGERGGGLLPPHPVLQLPLRPEDADRLLSAAERPPPVRVPADARSDQGADGGFGHCSFASRPPHRRRQSGCAAAPRLHLQCARGRALARGTGPSCRRRGADPKLIDTYESERKPHAKEMIDISVQMKNFVSLANPLLAKLRNVVVKTLLKTPKVGDYIREARFKPPPTYPQGAYFGLPRRRRNGAEGRPIPQPQVRTYEGRRALLDDFLGEDFALVGYAANPRAGLDAQSLAALTALGVRCVALYPYGDRP